MGGAKLKAAARILKAERILFLHTANHSTCFHFKCSRCPFHFEHLSCRVTAVASHTSVTWCPLKPGTLTTDNGEDNNVSTDTVEIRSQGSATGGDKLTQKCSALHIVNSLINLPGFNE